MSATNTKTRAHRKDPAVQLAGGVGASAAVQNNEQLLRRAVLANLLWEDPFYGKGSKVAAEITRLVPLVPAATVARIAVEARVMQKLRHVPLLLARECARNESHRHVVADLLDSIIQRPDELTEFLALYWKDKRVPLSNQVKIGLARAFCKFNAYQLGKYNRENEIRLRDVLFLSHAKPKDDAQAAIWKQLIADTLPVPDTWEVALSTGKDKRATWTRLIMDQKIGGLAFLRNLSNMEKAEVSKDTIRAGFTKLRSDMLLPLNYFAAAKAQPKWIPEIEMAMFAGLGALPKLAGESVLIVDVSGSMGGSISSKSDFSRLDAAAAMAVLAREVCEHVTMFATAGNDGTRVHKTKQLPSYRGFALTEKIEQASRELGGGGIFTRQCLEWTQGFCKNADRVIVFSDSQDCDRQSSRMPAPYGKRNYIVDVSSELRGINYKGVWTAEISGWSEHFLAYIAALEAGFN